jgi:hypothetical protein
MDISMYAQGEKWPAKCSMKWPQEHFVQILDCFLVELKDIIKEKEWWWWCPFW